MRRAEKIFIGAAILLLPFIFSFQAGEQMREPKARALIIFSGLFLSWEIADKISWALGGAASVAYIWAIAFSLQFPYFPILSFSAALGSCLLIAKAKENDIKIGLEVLEIAGLLCAAYAAIQYAGLDPIMTTIPGSDYHRVQVFFGQHTLYGPFAVACAACALFRERYFRAAFLFLPVFAIDASFTYLSAGVVAAMFLLFRFGGRALLGLSVISALLLGAGCYFYRNQDYVKYEPLNDNGRFALWKTAFRIARARPILGHGGIGSFAEQFPVFQSIELRKKMGIDESKYSDESKRVLKDAEDLRARSGWFFSPHNEFLGVFYEFGVVGLLFAISLVFTFLWWWLIAHDSPENWIVGAIFFSFMANSLGNFPLHLIPQALLPLWAYTIVTTERDRGIL